MQELIRLSDRVIVMSKRGRRMLKEIYKMPVDRIDLVPHGIPDLPFVDPNLHKAKFALEGKRVLFTFGLLSPGKGLEYVIRALPEVLRAFPDLVYVVLGATHPNLLREQGENYRRSLERLVASLGLKKHVIFENRFVRSKELMEFFSAADIYITPYLNANQITSGTLAYSFGCGKAIVSTPYWHAEELLADGRGVLVPFRDSDAIAHELIALFRDEVRLQAMRKEAYLLGREMVWNQVAKLALSSFGRARVSRATDIAPRLARKKLSEETRKLPDLQLNNQTSLAVS